jgi:hypothetical protein
MSVPSLSVPSFPWSLALGALLSLLLAACGGPGEAEANGVPAGGPAGPPAVAQPPVPSFPAGASFSYAGPVLNLPARGPEEQELHETEADWAIAAASVAWGRTQGLQGLPVGEVAAILGSTFVGSPYVPGGLELPGPERLVVNLSTFDCVTFVEHMLVLARLVVDPAFTPSRDQAGDGGRGEGGAAVADDRFRERYRRELAAFRYRHGHADGYESRLHYFTEWMDRGIEGGRLEEVTAQLGGIPDPRPIHFMTSNPEAYRQLREGPELLPFFREKEARLSGRTRLFVPQGRIAEVEAGVRNGDVIAAVSTVEGLDIAHTGLAIWHDGRLHLLHAPLVGDSVEISARPLAERIQGIRGQSGIRVVRPLDP